MSTEQKDWKLWLHGKASEAMSAQEVWAMLKTHTITEDTLVECRHDARGWSALSDYKEALRWQADARPAIVPQMPAPELAASSEPAPEFDFGVQQVIGCILLIIGLIMGLMALGMDISVTTAKGGSVNNIGLMNDRMVLMMAGGFLALIGTVMLVIKK